LEWEIERDGNHRAVATAKGDANGGAVDTLHGLAWKVGFHGWEAEDEVPKWLRLTGGGWLSSGRISTPLGKKTREDLEAYGSKDLLICPGEKVKIPNTVLAYFAESSNLREYYGWGDDVKTLKDRGFKVVQKSNSWKAERLEAFIRKRTRNGKLHGIVFQGHGGFKWGKPYGALDPRRWIWGKAEKNWKGVWTDYSKIPIPDDGRPSWVYREIPDSHPYFSWYRDWDPAYPLPLGIMYVCGGAAARTAGRAKTFSWAENSVFFGLPDVLYPISRPTKLKKFPSGPVDALFWRTDRVVLGIRLKYGLHKERIYKLNAVESWDRMYPATVAEQLPAGHSSLK
jgi:hypothetical protein